MKIGPIKPKEGPALSVRHRPSGQRAIGIPARDGRTLYAQFNDRGHPKAYGWWPMPRSQFDRVGPIKSWTKGHIPVWSAVIKAVCPKGLYDDPGNGGPMHYQFLNLKPKADNY